MNSKEIKNENYVEFKYHIGTYYSVPVASVLGLEYHQTTTSTL